MGSLINLCNQMDRDGDSKLSRLEIFNGLARSQMYRCV